MPNKHLFALVFLLGLTSFGLWSQDSMQIVAFGNIPTWTGVITEWQTKPTLRIFSKDKYGGHAEFVRRGLGRSITFDDFHRKVDRYAGREYLAVFLYDLRKCPLSKNGKTYSWAIFLEDYQYSDTPEQLAETIAKAQKTVLAALPHLPKDGCAAIPVSGKNNYNIGALATLLTKLGVAYTTTTEITKNCKSLDFQVLNAKEAKGKVRWIRKKEELLKVTENDIVVLDFLPEKLPPVAGIVTTVPQTPLSHVNLLAKNRGTLNLYVTEAQKLPELTKYEGKYVRIQVAGKQKPKFSPIDSLEAFAFNKSKRPKPLEIPLAKNEFESLIPLTADFVRFQTPEHIGAKASNYAFLKTFLPEQNMRPGFALGFAPYHFVTKQGAAAPIEQLQKQRKELSPEQQQSMLKEIRRQIKNAKLPQETLTSLRKAIEKHFPNSRMRLRSSTNCEDLPRFNGAGLYLSEGFDTNKPDSTLIKKILKVYASLWTWEAFSEREYFGIDHTQAAMAILVHQAFSDEGANGVVLTNPLPSKEVEILVNAQFGDKPIVSPETGDVPESFRLLSNANKITEILTRSNLGNVFLDNTNNAAALTDLKKQVLLVHQRFTERQKALGDQQKYGVDIEFKLMKSPDGKPLVFIKQARLLSEIVPE